MFLANAAEIYYLRGHFCGIHTKVHNLKGAWCMVKFHLTIWFQNAFRIVFFILSQLSLYYVARICKFFANATEIYYLRGHFCGIHTKVHNLKGAWCVVKFHLTIWFQNAFRIVFFILSQLSLYYVARICKFLANATEIYYLRGHFCGVHTKVHILKGTWCVVKFNLNIWFQNAFRIVFLS